MTAGAEDFAHMGRALQLARRGLCSAHPNPRVGCVIVGDGGIVGEGWHAVTGGPHAEVVALEQAAERAVGSTAYVTLEPCCHSGRTPPCTEALVRAGVRRVVFAVSDPNPQVAGAGERRLREAGIAVESGVLQQASRDLNPGFFSRMERGRPWLRSKLAVSLDGRTALASGASRWISSEVSRRDGHGLRARSSAILTGAGTIIADDPALTARRPDLDVPSQPARIILDSALRTPPGARVLAGPGLTRIFCVRPEFTRQRRLEAAGAVIETVPAAGQRPDLDAVLRRLAELEMNEVLCEAGPVLNGALLQAGLLDELVVYLAPSVLGSEGRGMFALPPLADMEQRYQFVLIETRPMGLDCRLTFRRREA